LLCPMIQQPLTVAILVHKHQHEATNTKHQSHQDQEEEEDCRSVALSFYPCSAPTVSVSDSAEVCDSKSIPSGIRLQLSRAPLQAGAVPINKSYVMRILIALADY
jgi:hypothetical protein